MTTNNQNETIAYILSDFSFLAHKLMKTESASYLQKCAADFGLLNSKNNDIEDLLNDI